MQEYQQLAPDAELFARVWQRVMPDESLSQIVVRPPEPSEKRTEQEAPTVREEKIVPEGEWLKQLLELVQEGTALAVGIRGRRRETWPLGESIGRSANRLSRLWFLLTGQRWQQGRRSAPEGTLPELLRELYLWEIQFSGLCHQGAEQYQWEAIGAVMPGLEEDSRRRRRTIMGLLGI